MYSEWRSLCKDIETSQQHVSVLHNFPELSAREIACIVVRSLSQAASNTGASYASDSTSVHTSLSQHLLASPNGGLLQEESQVRWTMQTLCYALCLPFSEYDTINECVQVYCGWLVTSLLPVNIPEQQRNGSISHIERGTEKQKYAAPPVVRENANAYAQEIFAHFRNLFMPRSSPQQTSSSSGMQTQFGPGAPTTGTSQCDLLTKQTVLCRRVLNTVKSVARYSENMTSETWTSLLSFLIAANDVLLSPPSGDELSEQLGAVALHALIDCWLIACARHFPSPSLWKTLVEVCKRWRHHDALVTEWFRATYILTVYVLRNVFHVSVPTCVLPVDADELCSIPSAVGMSSEAIINAWFRFLHALGNPVDLAHARVIGNTEAFARAVSSWNPDTLALSEHPCLSNLPAIFAHAMRALAALVDMLLDTFHVPVSQLQSQISSASTASNTVVPGGQQLAPTQTSTAPAPKSGSGSERNTPPTARKFPSRSVIMMPSVGLPERDRERVDPKAGAPKKSIVPQTVIGPGQPAPAPMGNSTQPQSQSQLNAAALVGSLLALNGAVYRVAMMPQSQSQTSGSPYAELLANRSGTCTLTSAPSANRLHFSVNTILHLFRNWLFEAAVTGVRVETRSTNSIGQPLYALISLRSSHIDSTAFETGRAEAAGALCRIFCSHRTNELIFGRYLARFYVCLHHGLRVNDHQNGLVLASILYYSSNLLRCDLDGVFVLLPRIFAAIDTVLLTEGDIKFKIPEFISPVELRRASMHLLLSFVCLPLHFGSIEIRELSSLISDIQRRQSMISLYGSGGAPAFSQLPAAEVPTFTFLSFKAKLIDLMLKVVPIERDAVNLHMVLCALVLMLSDLAAYEQAQAISNESTLTNGRKLPESEPGTLRRPLDVESVTSAIGSLCLESDEFSMGSKLQSHRSSGSTQHSGASLNAPEFNSGKVHVTYGDAELNSKSGDCDSAFGLYSTLTSLICNRLVNMWSRELSTTITALESLAALARIRVPTANCTLMARRVVNWLCEWLASQIAKPQTWQTRDLHSTLVAGYSVVQLWLSEHPRVLLDRAAQHTVLETIELGISGSKSQAKPSDAKKYKDAKGRHPSPASKRVLEAADSLLMTVLDLVGSYPPPAGPEATWSLVDEITVLEYSRPYSALLIDASSSSFAVQQALGLGISGSESASSSSLPSSAGINTLLRDPFGVLLTHRRQPSEQEIPYAASGKRLPALGTIGSLRLDASFKPPFRYFAIENSLILCLCEQPLNGAGELVPAITAIVRGPFGRHAWCMQMRHLPVGAANYCALTPAPTPENGHNMRQVAHNQTHSISFARRYSKTIERPIPQGSYATFERNASPKYFPESVDSAPLTKSDASVLPLEQVGNERRAEIDVLKSIISKQGDAEQRVAERVRNEKVNAPFPNPDTECRRPNHSNSTTGKRASPTMEFQTARMFLMHYGFLTLDGIRADNNPPAMQQSPTHAVAPPSSLSLLDCSTTDFFTQLELLDQLPTRLTDLAYAFYVRSGQRTVDEILQNSSAISREKEYAYFSEFLLAVGWPVDPLTHNGWTGNTHESLHNFVVKQKTSMNESDSSNDSGASAAAAASGVQLRKVPGRLLPQATANADLTAIEYDCYYWADVQREFALLVPKISLAAATNLDSLRSSVKVKINSNSSIDSAFEVQASRSATDSVPEPPVRIRPDIAELLESDSDTRRAASAANSGGATARQAAPKRVMSHSPEVRIFIFWLENFEDKDTLPISELLQTFPFSDGIVRDREKDVYIIGLHLLQTGLVRVVVQPVAPNLSKYGLAGPCVDGMVVSRRALGPLLRDTAINIHRRRRLEAADGQYQPPHVKRRTKIQEIINKYKCRLSEPDFFVSLFQEP